MRLTVLGLAIALTLLPRAGLVPAGEPGPETQQQRAARLQWRRQARFGLFIHWGPVSLKGTELSWSRANTNPACPNQGPIPAAVYDNLYKEFNPVKFDAAGWVNTARAAGMKYMVLTAKHCDGFCLWHSKAADYNISQTPFKRDVCGELAAAAHKAGMRIGWYYSPMDWRDPDCRSARNDKYVASMQGQLRELLGNYGPIDLLWFDTDACPAPWDQANTYRLVRTLQPKIVINNRLDMGSHAAYNQQAIGPEADYYTPEQHIGGYDDRRPWESCMMLGTQWSWKPEDRIKSLAECVEILVRGAGGDGNLLLDTGPMPSGQIEPRQAQRLLEIGHWLDVHGESIYGTRGGPFKPSPALASTRKGNVVYVHVLKWRGKPGDFYRSVRLPALPRKIVSASILRDGALRLTGGGGYHAPVKVESAGKDTVVTVGASDREDMDTVIKLTLDGPADDIPAVEVPGGG